MNYFYLLGELLALLFMCQLIGRRFTILLPNVMQRTIGFYISPLLGLAFLVLFATLYGWISPFHWKISLFSASIFVGFSFLYEKNKRQLFKDYVQISLFTIICSLPVLATAIHYEGFNPFTDIFTYLEHAQWLQTHSFSEKALLSGYHPAYTQIGLYQIAGSRMGGSFLFAYIQSLFALNWSYYAYLPTVALVFVIGCLTLGAIIRQVVPVRRSIVLLLALLPCFTMNGFVFGAEWGFFPQTFGLAFAAGLAALFPFLISVKLKNKTYGVLQLAISIIPLSLCTAALLFAYNEPFPLFLAALSIFILFVSFYYRKKIFLLACLLGLYFVEVAVLVNYEGIRIVRNLIQTIGIAHNGAIGWPILWKPIQFFAQAFGMKSAFQEGLYTYDNMLSLYVFPVVLIAICFALFFFTRKEERARLTIAFLLCVNFILLLAFIKFRYFAIAPTPEEVGSTFLQFKLSKYSTLFSLALLGIAIASIWHNKKILGAVVVSSYVLLGIIGLRWHFSDVAPQLNMGFSQEIKQKMEPFNVLLNLRQQVQALPENDTIYLSLGAEHHKLRQMVSYVLYDRKLASDYRDDGYLGRIPGNQKNMSSENTNWIMLLNSPNNFYKKSEFVLGPFIVQKAPFNYIKLTKSEGGFATEYNEQGDVWNWVNHAITFYFDRVGQDKNVKFKFKLANHLYARSVKIDITDMAGKKIKTYTLNGLAAEKVFTTPAIYIKPEQFMLRVEVDGKPEQISPGDTREVKFVISNVSAYSS